MKVKIDPLDKLFSEYIRKRAVKNCGGCEFCGKHKEWKELQCSHFFGRRHKNTRWHPDNAAGLCFACHMRLGEDPAVHTQWFKDKLGLDKFFELSILARSDGHGIDKEAIKADLKAKIKEL